MQSQVGIAEADRRAALELPSAARLTATISVMLASGMQAADATIANVALPQLEGELGGDGIAGAAWVLSSYLCATAIVAPLTGGLRRRFGPRALFVAVTALFAAASLLCATAPSAGAIVVFRILQGAAGGIIHPLSQAILLDLYPREKHGRIMSAWGATVMLGPILGPILGGVITDLASWRFVFVVNLPLAAIAIWAMRRSLPTTVASAQSPIDLVGVPLLAIAVGALQLFLMRGVGRSWLDSPELIIEGAVALICFTAFTVRAQRVASTAFRPVVFANANFAAAAFYNFVMSALLFVVVVFVPALMQGPLHASATVAGLVLVPRGIATLLTILSVGWLLERLDGRLVLAAGLMLMVIGLETLATARPPDATAWIVVGSVLQAAGGGLLLTSLSTIGFSTLAPELRTDAAGVYSLVRQLGCASGVALMTTVVDAQLDANVALLRGGLTAGTEPPAALLALAGLDAYSASFRAMAIAALVTVPGIMLFRVQSLRRRTSLDEPI